MPRLYRWIVTLGLLVASPVAAQPESVADDIRRGTVLLETGDLQGAEAVFRDVLEAQPSRAYRVWTLLGRIELLRRDGATARESFDRALLAAPRFGPALLGRARAAVLLGELDRALEDSKTASELPATATDASTLEAQVLVYLGRLDEARRRLEALVEGEMRSANRMLLEAISPSDTAETRLKVELGRNLDLPPAYLALGIFYLQRGHAERAGPPLRIALEMAEYPSMARLFLERAEGKGPVALPDAGARERWTAARRSARNGRADAADRASREVLAQWPYFVPARLMLIEHAEEGGDRWEAMAQYRQLLQWLPGVPVLLARRAQLAHTMGATELAEQSVLGAIDGFPEDGALHHLLASIQVEAGRTEAALAAAQRALELGFRTSHAYVTLGKILRAEMRVAEATDAYARALEIEPGVVEVLSSASVSALMTEEYAHLEEGLERHAEAHPENVDTLYALALMSLRRNDLERSRKRFQRAADLAPTRSAVHYHLGLVLLREGNEEAAQAAMTRFRELKDQESEEFQRHNRAHFLRLEAEEATAAGEPARAIDIYTGIVASGVRETKDYLALAAAWRQVGDDARAFAWYESVLEAEPYHHEALEGLALAAEGIQRSDVAERCRERVGLLAP